MKIIVQHEREFGQDRFYGLSDDAKTLLNLMKRQSFTKNNILLMTQAKWDVEIKSSPLPEIK